MVEPSLLAPFHILSYGTLLGAQVYQTFAAGIIAFRALPRPQFSTLQASIFPVYFSLQAGLPVVLALTYPGEKTIAGVGPSGLSGVVADGHLSTLLPIATVFISGLANRFVIGPQTTKVMRERRHQETIDGKKSYDPAPHSKEMVRLNKSFGRMHGISSAVSLTAVLATVYYGTILAQRLQ
ncbi:hypothetical protein AJ80_05367 [Polytolypa hystricis UAMH7299]|uniref:TMEM205-like domain-containing protein n=1 Tax=Polytolypa hystricis (strain UAMH7299) TaxID=1447883 RepID=A0A2B7Y4L4_POLH7|nr:hypothetical protein AJ80_05367 [Polytolypa hystricis UAMH7299]